MLDQRPSQTSFRGHLGKGFAFFLSFFLFCANDENLYIQNISDFLFIKVLFRHWIKIPIYFTDSEYKCTCIWFRSEARSIKLKHGHLLSSITLHLDLICLNTSITNLNNLIWGRT